MKRIIASAKIQTGGVNWSVTRIYDGFMTHINLNPLEHDGDLCNLYFRPFVTIEEERYGTWTGIL